MYRSNVSIALKRDAKLGPDPRLTTGTNQLCVNLTSVISLVLALQWGGQASSLSATSSWNTPRVIALLVVFAVTLFAFIGWQTYMQDRALLPPKVFAERTVLGSFGYMWFFAASMTVIFYYVPV